MSDEDGEEEPIVELGERTPVDGAPLARLTSRLHFGIPKSDVVHRIGDVEIRTPDGPRELSDLLEQSEETYFPRRQDLEDAVNEIIGTGPVPTEE